MREENFLGLRRFIGRRRGLENFRRLSTIFLEFFQNFPQFFSEFSAIFWKIFPKIFAIFSDFATFLRFFPENFRPQSVTVQPGFRHYCKFTIKFTPKFTLILIKILQSTKFEGSHFYGFLSTF